MVCSKSEGREISGRSFFLLAEREKGVRERREKDEEREREHIDRGSSRVS
jgi:hypothetical protein